MANRVTDILTAHCDHWKSIIPMLENGIIGANEMREGKRADTTGETITEFRCLLAEPCKHDSES